MTGKPLLVIYKCTHNIRRGTEYLFLLPRKEFAYWSCQSSFNIRWRKKPALPVTQPVNLLLPNRSFLFHVEFHHSSIMNKYCRWSYSLQYLVCTKVYIWQILILYPIGKIHPHQTLVSLLATTGNSESLLPLWTPKVLSIIELRIFFSLPISPSERDFSVREAVKDALPSRIGTGSI